MNNDLVYGKKLFRYVDRFVLELENTELLRIAGDDEVTQMLCDSDGCPLLPGTSIAGSIRSYFLENAELRKEYGYFFGAKLAEKPEEQDLFYDSKLYFYDSLMEDFNKKEPEEYLESRIENRHDEENGGAKDKALHTILYLKKGLRFRVQIEAFCYDQAEHDKALLMFQEILNGIDSGEILFGSRKNNGCGKMKSVDNKFYEFDLQVKKDFIAYAFDKKADYRTFPAWCNTSLKSNMTFTLEAKIKDALLIKTETETERIEKNRQSVDIDKIEIHDEVRMREENEKERNIASSMKSGEDYIIPGSSIKGVLRGYCEKIKNTLGLEDAIVKELFGSSTENNEEKKAGRVRVSDCRIDTGENPEEYELIYHRIKIDRFTGGVMNGALVTEKPLVKGKVNMNITFKKRDDEKENQKAFVLLYLCLRDIGLGKIPFGSNAGIGFGRLTGLGIHVRSGNKAGNIQFEPFVMDKWIREELEKGFAILKEERKHDN